MIFCFYSNDAFHNLILPPPSEDEFLHTSMSLFEHTVEHLIEEIELVNEISLSEALDFLARRYTATSV